MTNPRYRDQIAHAQNATTSFSGSRAQGKTGWYTMLVDYSIVDNATGKTTSTFTGETYGTYNPAVSLDTTDSAGAAVKARVNNRAIRKFLDSCASAQSSFEAGQDIGELKETLESIHRPLNSLKSGMLNYFAALKRKSRRVNRLSKLEKVIADTYLEFHFGWSPLADDVASLIADAQRFRFPLIPVRGQASETFLGSSRQLSNSNPGYTSVAPSAVTIQSKSVYSRRLKGVVRVPTVGGRISLAQSLQLTPKDFIPTVWDLLPYSWMADYFVNVGDILQALSFRFADLAWGDDVTRTHNSISVSDIFYIGKPPLPLNSHFGKLKLFTLGGSSNLDFVTFQRTPLIEGALLPSFSFRVPTSKYPFYNMGALLSSRGISVSKYLSKNYLKNRVS